MTWNFDSVAPLSPDDARKQLLAGNCPDVLCVNGSLELSLPEASPSPMRAMTRLFKGSTSLQVLPRALKARRVNVANSSGIEQWPEMLQCLELNAQGTVIQVVPSPWKIELRLDLANCLALRELPQGFRTGALVLRGCTSLRELPEDLSVYFLDLSGCTALQSFPQRGEIRMGNLNMSGCSNLTELPAWLGTLSQLDVSGCSRLLSLPEGLRVTSWIEVADCGLSDLPASLREAPLRFRGVPVSYREVFQRDSLQPGDVLEESNAERRRVLLELLGYERFITEAKARTLDCDTDAGGERRLLKVEMQDDEPLVVLAVFCPSTGHQYTLRVPPQTATCRSAAAWIAGFDKADDYVPLKET